MSSPFVFRPTASPQEAANWSRRQIMATDLRAVVGRAFPRQEQLGLREREDRESFLLGLEKAPDIDRAAAGDRRSRMLRRDQLHLPVERPACVRVQGMPCQQSSDCKCDRNRHRHRRRETREQASAQRAGTARPLHGSTVPRLVAEGGDATDAGGELL